MCRSVTKICDVRRKEEDEDKLSKSQTSREIRKDENRTSLKN